MSRAPTANDYAVLGLTVGAGAAEVRAAYRRLAKIHHPDRNPGDAAALATFRRLTESYAALRDRAGGAGEARRSPLGAAQEARRRSVQAAAAAFVRVGDLPAGGAAWLEADAVLVGPDRAVALRPDAPGTPFPGVERVIRVERRPDGLHVFMPPQPLARWAVGPDAEIAGVAVAALWVGDRQEGETGSHAATRLPLRLVTRTVGEMVPGDRGWAAANALGVSADGAWSLDPAQPLGTEPHRATPVRVLRDDDGFRVHSDLPAATWPIGDPKGEARVPVLTATLAGVQHLPTDGG